MDVLSQSGWISHRAAATADPHSAAISVVGDRKAGDEVMRSGDLAVNFGIWNLDFEFRCEELVVLWGWGMEVQSHDGSEEDLMLKVIKNSNSI